MVTPCRSYICLRPTLEGLIPHIKSILPKGPYLPCVSMVGRALLAGYAWFINPLRWIQNWPHFADDISKCIFLNENVWISLKISLKIVPEIPINNISPLGQIMAWHWPGNKPISEPMMVSLLTHICVTQPQWVNTVWTSLVKWAINTIFIRLLMNFKVWIRDWKLYISLWIMWQNHNS